MLDLNLDARNVFAGGKKRGTKDTHNALYHCILFRRKNENRRPWRKALQAYAIPFSSIRNPWRTRPSKVPPLLSSLSIQAKTTIFFDINLTLTGYLGAHFSCEHTHLIYAIPSGGMPSLRHHSTGTLAIRCPTISYIHNTQSMWIPTALGMPNLPIFVWSAWVVSLLTCRRHSFHVEVM